MTRGRPGVRTAREIAQNENQATERTAHASRVAGCDSAIAPAAASASTPSRTAVRRGPLVGPRPANQRGDPTTSAAAAGSSASDSAYE